MNRGPQLGFHNDISRGQEEPSAIQMRKLRWRVLQSLGRGLPSVISVHLPHEDAPGAGAPCWRSLSA
jgi:hypothetical protein